MCNIESLQEQLDNTFNSLRVYEKLAVTSPRPELRLMYRRRLDAECAEAVRLEILINKQLQEEINNV